MKRTIGTTGFVISWAIVAACTWDIVASHAPIIKTYRGTVAANGSTAVEDADRVVSQVEAMRHGGYEPSADDFSLPPNWHPPESWDPPAEWQPPAWFPK